MAAEPTSAPSINLICGGQGAANRATMATGFFRNNTGGSATGQVFGQQSVGYDDQVRLEMPATGRARIRMPRALLPTIRGGKNGWFWIDSVRMTDNDITGVVQVSVLNSPKLRLDRIAGHISISGKTGDYSGVCEPFDPASVQRRF